jgi:FKBP-type peptidyl-prolyl cis-trans isomerase (trigger factor)
MSIFNPWGELRQAREELAEARFQRALSTNELLSEIARRENERKEFELRSRLLKSEIDRLTDLLKKAHFRNPKTGRIGKKGERFK